MKHFLKSRNRVNDRWLNRINLRLEALEGRLAPATIIATGSITDRHTSEGVTYYTFKGKDKEGKEHTVEFRDEEGNDGGLLKDSPKNKDNLDDKERDDMDKAWFNSLKIEITWVDATAPANDVSDVKPLPKAGVVTGGSVGSGGQAITPAAGGTLSYADWSDLHAINSSAGSLSHGIIHVTNGCGGVTTLSTNQSAETYTTINMFGGDKPPDAKLTLGNSCDLLSDGGWWETKTQRSIVADLLSSRSSGADQ